MTSNRNAAELSDRDSMAQLRAAANELFELMSRAVEAWADRDFGRAIDGARRAKQAAIGFKRIVSGLMPSQVVPETDNPRLGELKTLLDDCAAWLKNDAKDLWSEGLRGVDSLPDAMKTFGLLLMRISDLTPEIPETIPNGSALPQTAGTHRDFFKYLPGSGAIDGGELANGDQLRPSREKATAVREANGPGLPPRGARRPSEPESVSISGPSLYGLEAGAAERRSLLVGGLPVEATRSICFIPRSRRTRL